MVNYLTHGLYDRRISMKMALFFWGVWHKHSHGFSPLALGLDVLSGECVGYPKVTSLSCPRTCGDQSVV